MLVKFSFKTILIVLVTLALTVLGIINIVQKAKYETPEDGCGWIATTRGVEAFIVERDGPGDKAGIQPGDIVEAIDHKRITRATEVTGALYTLGIWSKAKYSLLRDGVPIETTLVVAPQPRNLRFKQFLEFVGFMYLLIGVFIFLRRWQARGALHFYTICLASFVLYTYSFTNKLNDFDWTIYWLDEIAFALLPPLFLHFCLAFPEPKRPFRKGSFLTPVLYLPGLFLLLVQCLFITGHLNVFQAPLVLRIQLDRIHTIHFATYFVLGMVSLVHTYFNSKSLTLRQQMRWIVLGTAFGTLPFLCFYAVPFWLGVVPTTWMEVSVLPLVLIPLTFGYAIIKYRLMDVDIIFRRGMASTLASLAVVGFYFALIAVVTEVFRASKASPIWVIISLVVAAFVFSPLRNWMQERVDRYFYRDRYDYRKTLIDFGRTLGSEINLKHMLDSVVERVSQTLLVDKIAIFLRDENDPKQFHLVKSLGMSASAEQMNLGFLDPERPALRKGYLFYESLKQVISEPPEYREVLRRLDLNYYLPCVIAGQTIAFLGLGRTTKGDLLTSEDVELLQTIAGYVAIAIENGRLYRSIQENAEQLQALKEYSENILESINVGVLVLGLDERVESWNTQMESLIGVPRSQAIGKTLGEIFPENLAEAIRFQTGGRIQDRLQTLRLYKFPVKLAGRSLVLDVTVTPLIGKNGGVSGQVVSLDDKTERVKLEEQLVQTEKLTSIGLLAAGVAHEVNTPLAVISSYSQMLHKQLNKEDPRIGILDKIIKQSFRASEIVNSLLNFSRTSSSEFRDIDLHGVLSDTLSLLDHQFKVARIKVKKEFGSGGSRVYGNPGKLQQVFLNLFINAKDAMPSGGELVVKTTGFDSVLRIEVIDTGVGILREHLSKIYDPFFTTKELGRGTGLGLSVSYGIIQEHSGKIFVDSRPGEGTRFVLDFPASRKVANV
ncbi:MAG TPA: ATP-binding protein [Terriglobia bacterium]|nr:ATP-binding protein [Terriglobia bacterium]